jgi:hypothetical protein
MSPLKSQEINPIHSSLKKNKVPRNNSNQGDKYNENYKILKKTLNERTFHVLGLEELVLFK